MSTPGAPDPTGELLDHAEAGNRAIRGSVLRSGAYVGGILVTLVSAPLLVRHLGVAGFGQYSLVGNTVAAFATLVDAGLLTIAQREYVARQGADRDRTMAALVGLRLTMTGLAVSLAILFCIVSGYGHTLVTGAVLAGVGTMIIATQHMTGTPLNVELRLGATSAIDFLGQVGQSGLVILLVILGAKLLPFFATGILLGGIALVVTKYLVRDKFPLWPSFDRRLWWSLLRGALPYVAAAAITGLYFRLALIVLAQTSTELETGYYATSFRLLEIIIGVPALLVSAAFPVMARAADQDEDRLRYQVGRVWEVALILGLWFVVGITLMAPFALEFIAGSNGGPSVPVLRLQGPAVLFTFFAVASAFPLLALRRHAEVLRANLAALVTGAIAVGILAPAAGAEGTAVATLVAEGVLAATMTGYLWRELPGVSLPAVTLPIALACAGAALCLLLVPVHPIVRAVLGTAVYFGGLALFRRLPEEALVALHVRRFLPKRTA